MKQKELIYFPFSTLTNRFPLTFGIHNCPIILCLVNFRNLSSFDTLVNKIPETGMIYVVNSISRVHPKPKFRYSSATTKVIIYCINITL